MFFGFIIIIFIVLIYFSIQFKSSGENTGRKIDKIGSIFNIILSILYVPMSYVGILGLMASEGIESTTNQLYANLIKTFCNISLSTPVLCIAGIFLSILFRKKGKSILSFFIQFIPLIIFILNVLFLYVIDKFYK